MSLVGVTFCVACHRDGRDELDAMFRPGREAAATVAMKLDALAEQALPKVKQENRNA